MRLRKMMNFRGRVPKVLWWVILALIVVGLAYFMFRGWKEGFGEVTPPPAEGVTPTSSEGVTPTSSEGVPPPTVEVVPPPTVEVVPPATVEVVAPTPPGNKRAPRHICPKRDPDNTVQAMCSGACNLTGYGGLTNAERIVCSDKYCIGCGNITAEQRKEVAEQLARNAAP